MWPRRVELQKPGGQGGSGRIWCIIDAKRGWHIEPGGPKWPLDPSPSSGGVGEKGGTCVSAAYGFQERAQLSPAQPDPYCPLGRPFIKAAVVTLITILSSAQGSICCTNIAFRLLCKVGRTCESEHKAADSNAPDFHLFFPVPKPKTPFRRLKEAVEMCAVTFRTHSILRSCLSLPPHFRSCTNAEYKADLMF